MARPAPSKQGSRAELRAAARLAAVQALYQMDLAATPLSEILAEFESHWIGREVEGDEYRPAELAYFRDVVGGVVAEQRRLDPMIDAALARGWPLKRIETVLRAILRAGAYELDCKHDHKAPKERTQQSYGTEHCKACGASRGRDGLWRKIVSA